jgi:hypothetical protein
VIKKIDKLLVETCRFLELLAGLEPLTAFQNPFIYKAFSVYTPIARQFDFL